MSRSLSIKAVRIAARVIPAGASLDPRSTDTALVYVYTDQQGRPCARAFVGSAAKPCFAYYFKSEALREVCIVDFFYNATRIAERKSQQLAARVQFTHTLQIGDVVYTSWGYEQTNVSFYEVTRVVSGRSVGIRRIASTPSAGPASSMSGYFSAVRGEFTGVEAVRRVREGNVVVNADGDHAGYLWDGSPKYGSWYG